MIGAVCCGRARSDSGPLPHSERGLHPRPHTHLTQLQATSMSFAFEAPLPEPSTSNSPLLPILSTLLDAVPVPPRLLRLAEALLAAKVNKTVKREMYELSGALRDEWKARVGAVKADWMARIVSFEEDDREEDEGEEPKLKPTIVSDVDGREEMISRVDKAVEAEFEARVAEAEARVRKAAKSKELMEVELLLGEAVS